MHKLVEFMETTTVIVFIFAGVFVLLGAGIGICIVKWLRRNDG